MKTAAPTLSRRAALAVPGLLLATRAARAATEWPERPVRVIVTYSAGGAADTIARLLQPGMSQALGQQVVIENRPGAGGTLGAIAAARSPADGYVLLFDAAAHVVAPLIFRNLPVDYTTAFSYLGRATIQPYAWVVSSAFPAQTAAEFIAVARARAQPVTYGTPGVGSSGHIAGAAFAQAADLQLEHIPYRGGALAANDLASGNLDAACITLSSAQPIVEAGRARILATSGGQRSQSHPDVPTLAESGLPGFDVTSWLGLFGPAGLPPAIIAKASAALTAAASDPATQAILAGAGFEAAPSNAADFAAQVRRDREVFGEVVRRAGISAD